MRSWANLTKCKKIHDFPAVLHFPDRLSNTFVSKSHKIQEKFWFSSSSAFSGPFIEYVREQISQNATKCSLFQQFCIFRTVYWIRSWANLTKCNKILDFPAVLHFPDRLLNTFVSISHKMQQNAWFSSSSAFSGPFIEYVREQISQNARKYVFFQQICIFRTVSLIRSWANLTKCNKILGFPAVLHFRAVSLMRSWANLTKCMKM